MSAFPRPSYRIAAIRAGLHVGRKAAALVTLIVLALGSSSCALSLQSLPKVASSNGATYPLRASFADVLNLPQNAQVRLGAEVVGDVTSIAARNFAADLTLSIRSSVKLPVGTTAQIRFDNPLGDEYVLLQIPPTGPGQAYLQPNSEIGEQETSTAASVEDTFGALSLVLNGGGLNQLQTIIHELNDTFDGNQPQIRSLLTTIDTGARTVAGGMQAVDAAIASIDSLSHKLAGGRNTIANGIQSIGPAIGVLASENSQISSLLSELSNLGVIGTRVAEQSGQSSVQDVQALLPLVEQLSAVQSQLGPDVKDLALFEADTPKVAPGDYLQVSAVVNVLLPSGGFEPGGPAPTSTAASTDGSPAGSASTNTSGSRAVSTILGAGLI